MHERCMLMRMFRALLVRPYKNHHKLPLTDLFLAHCLSILHVFQYEFVDRIDRILSYTERTLMLLSIFFPAFHIKLVI